MGTRLYTAWAYGVFLIFLTGAFFSALLLPGLERRRRWVSRFDRGFFRAAGIDVTVRGRDNLPDGTSIVVANHASYLDGVILQAYLPPRYSYVIKSEMRDVPLGGLMLRRIGSRFVERFVTTAGARDTRVLLRAARDGESLGFFPEGTFRAEPGLGKFRSGAFLTAIKAELPVVPVAILGSRRMLPARSWLVRRGSLTVDIRPAIPPDYAGMHARDLAAEARRRLLEVLDEPDLSGKV